MSPIDDKTTQPIRYL